jgi:lipopolysaccharide export system permease protein
MKIVDRYVLKEMISPFLVSMFAFVVLWIGRVIYDNMDLIIEMRSPLPLVVRLVIYQIPWVLGMSLPLATLFSVSLSVNRLGRDSEITSIRMAGTPIRRVFLPIFVIGLIASVVTFWLGESATPWANREAERTKRCILGLQRVPPIQENVFFQSEGYCFYVQRVERSGPAGILLHNIMVYEPGALGSYPRLITAPQASNQKNYWVLHNGVMHKLGDDGLTQYEAKFETMKLDLNRAVQALWDSQKTTEEMGFRELQTQIGLFSGAGREVTKMRVDWHFKMSIPLSCLVFALCAAPLSLKYSRIGSYSGILLGVVIMFFYWNILLLGKFLGSGGLVPPFLAGWSQDIVFTIIGVYLIWREE